MYYSWRFRRVGAFVAIRYTYHFRDEFQEIFNNFLNFKKLLHIFLNFFFIHLVSVVVLPRYINLITIVYYV